MPQNNKSGNAAGLATTVRDALAVAREHPFAALAYCTYTVWWSYALLGPLFIGPRDEKVVLLVVVPYALIGAACLAISLAFKQWRFALDSPVYRALVCAAMMVGTLCQGAYAMDGSLSAGPSTQVSYWLGYVLIAVGVGFFRIEMDRVFGWLGSQKTLHLVSIGTLLNLPAAVAMMFLPGPAGFAIAAVLPLAATLFLRMEVRAFPQKRYYGVDKELELPVPSQFIATSFVQGVANGMFYAPIAAGLAGVVISPLGSPASLISWPAGVAIAYAVTLVLHMDFNRLLYKVGFPLMALAFVLIALLPDASYGFIGDLAFYVAAVYADLVLWSLGAFIMRDMGMPACWIASFPGAALYGGTAVGALVVWLLATFTDDAMLWVEVVAMLLMACLLLWASLLLLSDKNLTSGWGTFRLGTRDDLATSLDVALVHIATEYGLTPREVDVVRALGQGSSRRGAAETLGVAEETVKTHMRAVYRKLDVHTQSELDDFIEMTRKSLSDAGAWDCGAHV